LNEVAFLANNSAFSPSCSLTGQAAKALVKAQQFSPSLSPVPSLASSPSGSIRSRNDSVGGSGGNEAPVDLGQRRRASIRNEADEQAALYEDIGMHVAAVDETAVGAAAASAIPPPVVHRGPRHPSKRGHTLAASEPLPSPLYLEPQALFSEPALVLLANDGADDANDGGTPEWKDGLGDGRSRSGSVGGSIDGQSALYAELDGFDAAAAAVAAASAIPPPVVHRGPRHPSKRGHTVAANEPLPSPLYLEPQALFSDSAAALPKNAGSSCVDVGAGDGESVYADIMQPRADSAGDENVYVFPEESV
jgi:hypothetical protein